MTDRAEPGGVRVALAGRLALALALLAALLGAFLWTFVAPSTHAALRAFGAAALEDSAATMRELTERQTAEQSRVLVDLIGHTAAARARALQDLPLESYAGDVGALRAAVLDEDRERSAHQRRNVEVLAAEVRRRADRDIDARLAALGAGQARATAAFVAELRRTHLWLVGATLAAALIVLGLGLHHLVVRPTRRLRTAAQAVARGELDIDLPRPTRDELGDLARDFAGMVGQLRRSRAELQRLADNLEHEVRNKTRHLERALAELESSHRKLAEAERLAALGTLAGGIAHEFHNLIGGIRGCAADLLADEPSAGRRETLGVIDRAAERATGIVRQLQRFARHRVETAQDLDLAQVLADALRLCEPAARRQAVTVERAFAAEATTVRGDGDALHQVFVNLLVNALQAMPDGGTLRVEVRRDGDDALAVVADSGQGIAAAALPHVFEPFFTTRADAAEPERRGSGLGLAVSHGIVAAHGGRIEAASQPGRGATFTVRLPRA